MKTFSQLFGKRQSLSNFGMWQLLFTVAGAISAADSIYVLYFPMKLQFEASFGSPVAALVVSLLVCAAYLLIVDISLMRFLPNTLAGIFDKNVGTGMKSNLGKLYWGTFLFCILQTAATVFVSFHLRHSSVEISSEAPVLTDIKALADGQNAAQKEKIAAADKEIARIKSDKEKAVNNVPQKAAKMQEWGKGGSYIERMNAFRAAQKSVEADNKAAKKAAGSVYDKQLEAALNAKNSVLNDPTLLAVVAAADTVNRANLQRHAKKTANFSDFLLIMSLAASFVLWFAGSMMGFHYAEFGVKHDTLMPGTTASSYSGAASAASTARTTNPSTPLNPFSYNTTQQVAIHEAGHFCAFAKMFATGENITLAPKLITITANPATSSTGHVELEKEDWQPTASNIEARLLVLAAGYAAECFAVATKQAITPLEYLKAIAPPDTPGSDVYQFNKMCEITGTKAQFETVYQQAFNLFVNDNVMLQRVASDLVTHQTVGGAALMNLWNNTVNWYRVKAGKEPITPSVETPKTAEKAVITEKEAVITEKQPVLQLSYVSLSSQQRALIMAQVSQDYTQQAWDDVLYNMNPICFIYDDGSIKIDETGYNDCISQLQRTKATITPVDPILSTNFRALFEDDRNKIVNKYLTEGLEFQFLSSAFVVLNPTITINNGVMEAKDPMIVIERAKNQQKSFYFRKELEEKEAQAALLAKPVIEAEKTVITAEKAVITEKQTVSTPIELEITQPSNESWLSNLKTIEVENETYTPNDLITAKSYILTYWSRAFSSKSDAKKEENREKALRFKTVLEMTGLKVELFENGKGKVTF